MITDGFAAQAIIDLEMDATQVQKGYFLISQGPQLCQSILSVRQNTQTYKFTCPQVFIENFTVLAFID